MHQKDFALLSESARKKVMEMIHRANAPHVGSALSCVELLMAAYGVSDIEKIRNQTRDRDYIILSKGHAISAQLAVLNQYGLLENKDLEKFCSMHSVFWENTSPFTPYIECATGSLGQGASFGVGVSLGMKIKKYKTAKTFVIMGDGELNEGQCWEAFEQAACLRLDNLFFLVDANRLAGIGKTCVQGSIADKMSAFGLEVICVDGHKVSDIIQAITYVKETGKPKAIVCRTIKGKGISFMENKNQWHYRPIDDSDFAKAMMELNHEECIK